MITVSASRAFYSIEMSKFGVIVFNFFLLILCEFHIMHSIPLISPVPLYPPSTIATSPSKTKKMSLWTRQCVTTVCPKVSSVKTSSLANVHCNEPWVWFETSGSCCTINTGSSRDILLLSCVIKILQLWICRTSPFTCFSHL